MVAAIYNLKLLVVFARFISGATLTVILAYLFGRLSSLWLLGYPRLCSRHVNFVSKGLTC